jgi:FAD/FMN-containing dehydrogenase
MHQPDVLSAEALATLRATISGVVIAPQDPPYEEARGVWNGMIDKHPAVIVRVADDADVVAVLELARTTGLALAIRGGGHNVAGNGSVDGGIVLDMGGRHGVEVDTTTRLVRVEGGATLRDVDAATAPHGLAVPIGVVSGTGVAGFTLGGGVGWLSRRYGLAIDNLVGADVILPDGTPVRASASSHPELFWALRGGGGNFGVVTSFTFQAYPHGPEAFAGTLVYERPRWREALRAWRAWGAGLPDEMTPLVTFMVPPADWELGDQVLMFAGYAWAGPDHEAGRAALQPMLDACAPDVAMTDPTPWIAFQSAFDTAMPKGVRAYWRNAWFATDDDAVLDAIEAGCAQQGRVGTAVDLHLMGGAFGRVPEDATAFPDRSARLWLNIYGFWSDPADDEANTAWVKGFSDTIRPLAMDRQYVNFMGREESGETGAGEPPEVRSKALAVYGPEKLARLARVKQQYDPANLLRINHNIPPAG